MHSRRLCGHLQRNHLACTASGLRQVCYVWIHRRSYLHFQRLSPAFEASYTPWVLKCVAQRQLTAFQLSGNLKAPSLQTPSWTIALQFQVSLPLELTVLGYTAWSTTGIQSSDASSCTTALGSNTEGSLHHGEAQARVPNLRVARIRGCVSKWINQPCYE